MKTVEKTRIIFTSFSLTFVINVFSRENEKKERKKYFKIIGNVRERETNLI